MPRVAAVIVNLVPYHHARWEAVARRSGMECHLIELTDQDAFRVLEFSAQSSYQRLTLFPGSSVETMSSASLLKKMEAEMDLVRPEVVCVSGWSLKVSLAALAWAAKRCVPIVMLSESNEFDEPRAAIKEFVKRQIVGLSSAGLTGGSPQKDYLVKLGLPETNVFPGYDAVDNEYFSGGAAKARTADATIRNELGLPSQYFLACSRFGQKKNLPGLIQAYARYRELFQRSMLDAQRSTFPWSLVIVGDGELRPEIEDAILQTGCMDRVHLVGAKSYPAMPNYYGLAGAFIHASTTEQWGLVVNEAMASGLPVLVSNRCGCAADLVQDGVNGFTFDPENVEQLADLMLQLSTFAPSHLSTLGSASQRLIADWGPERFASGLASAVHCALKAEPPKPTFLQRLLLRALLGK